MSIFKDNVTLSYNKNCQKTAIKLQFQYGTAPPPPQNDVFCYSFKTDHALKNSEWPCSPMDWSLHL